MTAAPLHIDVPGLTLAVTRAGTGPTLLHVHDMAGGPPPAALTQTHDVIAYDRRGYGASPAPPPYTGTTVEEQAGDAAALLEVLAPKPVAVAGEGFGALVALDLARRFPTRVSRLVLHDTPLYLFLPEGGDVLMALREELRAAVQSGGPQFAVETWLRGSDDVGHVERATRDAVAFLADFAGLASLQVTRRELRALSVPVTVSTSPAAAPPLLAIADRLAALLPQATRHSGDLAGAVLAAA